MITRSEVMIRIYLFIFLFFSSTAYGQSLYSELPFLNYLLKNRSYDDALLLLNSIEPTNELESDSLHYFLGKTLYFDQQLEESIGQFDKLSTTKLAVKNESMFFNAFNKAYLGRYNDALTDLTKISPSDSLLIGLKTFQESGLYLLRRDLESFDKASQSYLNNFYQFSSQQQSLLEIRKDLGSRKEKSPVKAGIMSAIIPGSGRIYAGKVGTGIGTLLTSVILGLQTREAYKKDGSESPRFIIFSSLLSVFYIGNIWGSVFTVKLANDEFNEAVNYKVLVDMHIPLRSIFN